MASENREIHVACEVAFKFIIFWQYNNIILQEQVISKICQMIYHRVISRVIIIKPLTSLSVKVARLWSLMWLNITKVGPNLVDVSVHIFIKIS